MPRYQCLGTAIAAAFCAFGLVWLDSSLLFGFFGIILFAMLAVCYSLLLSCGEAVWLPLAVGGGSVVLRAVLYSTEQADILNAIITLLFAFLCAVCLCVCARKKVRKSTTFAVVCVVYTAFVLADTVLCACLVYGFRADSLGQALRAFVDTVGEFYNGLLTAALAERGSDPEMQRAVSTLVEAVSDALLISLPSIVISATMLISAMTLFFYRIVAKTAKMTELCFEKRVWRFELTPVTVIFFYLCYAVYFFSGLVARGGLIYVTFMNLSMIFAYPFAYLGLRALYGAVRIRVKSRPASMVLLGVFLFVFAFVLGASDVLITLLAFIGAAYSLRRALAAGKREE